MYAPGPRPGKREFQNEGEGNEKSPPPLLTTSKKPLRKILLQQASSYHFSAWVVQMMFTDVVKLTILTSIKNMQIASY